MIVARIQWLHLFGLISSLLFCEQGYSQRTNIIYIMSDDHDADAIGAYNKRLIKTPHIDRLATEGMIFTKCFVSNSICSPVRASLLTGQFSHKNGVKDNQTPFDSSRPTFPKILQQEGYETALIGKWHLHSLPSGFDHWIILPGQGLYYDPRFIRMNNDTIRYSGYATEVITDEAIRWLKARDKKKPFVLLLHHKAPHRNFLPLPKYIDSFQNIKFPEPTTLYADSSDKGTAWKIQKMRILQDMRLCSDLKIDPGYLMEIPSLKPDSADIRYYHSIMNSIPPEQRTKLKEIYATRGKLIHQQQPAGKELLAIKYQWYMQDYLSCVASIDENIGKLLNYLEESGLTNNTAVIYTSDQGFYLGENGWFDKRFMYDVSMHTPLLIKWKGKIAPGTKNNNLVQNIDLAPTILDIAGVKIPRSMQGITLKPLLLNKQKQLMRDALYYHYYEYPFDHNVLPHLGIRKQQYKLIYFYTANEWELYDLKSDPFEQQNLVHSMKHQAVLRNMKEELKHVRKHYEDIDPKLE